MPTAFVAMTLTTIAANLFSGVTSLILFESTLSAIAGVGVPESWLTLVGALKTVGAAGLLLGLVGLPLIGTVFVIGFVVVVIGAISARIRARAYSPQLSLAFGVLLLAVTALVISLVS